MSATPALPTPRAWTAILAASAAALALQTPAEAAAARHGATWTERGDAGDLTTSAQAVERIGPVHAIRGSLVDGDADVFRICITGGRSFSATTVDGSHMDTQLSLFDRDGRGVYANDDAHGVQSRLPAGHSLTPRAGGKYYLAISSYDNDPVGAGGLIFPSRPFSGIHGPTGPGGAGALTGWTGTGFGTGQYTIFVTGVHSCGGPVDR